GRRGRAIIKEPAGGQGGGRPPYLPEMGARLRRDRPGHRDREARVANERRDRGGHPGYATGHCGTSLRAAMAATRSRTRDRPGLTAGPRPARLPASPPRLTDARLEALDL